ncbi:MAG: 16S rRNA (cytosine(1402)-N(4))-methyltransferase, partial [Gammaproteobacteria bacterium]
MAARGEVRGGDGVGDVEAAGVLAVVGTGTGELHAPVLLDEVMAHLGVREGGVYIDCTFGRG